jgi:hypothetical protein
MKRIRVTADNYPNTSISFTPREASWISWMLDAMDGHVWTDFIEEYEHFLTEDVDKIPKEELALIDPGPPPGVYEFESSRTLNINKFWLEDLYSLATLQLPDMVDEAKEYGDASLVDYRVMSSLQAKLKQALDTM